MSSYEEILRELREQLLQSFPEKIQNLEDRLQYFLQKPEQSELEELFRLVHQLHGTFGSYGFQEICETAGKWELPLRQFVDSPVLFQKGEAVEKLKKESQAYFQEIQSQMRTEIQTRSSGLHNRA